MTGRYTKSHTRAWADTVGALDGFVFVTPEYNHSTSAALKNAIDFLYAEWGNKAAGFVSYGATGGTRAVEHLRLVMAELQVADVRAQVSLSLRTDFTGYKEFTPHPAQQQVLSEVLDQVVAWSTVLKPLRTPNVWTLSSTRGGQVMTTVHFWFDPGCPFTWATSRWLVEVAGARNLDVRWHPMSLAILNADKDIPQRYRELLAASGRRVRTVAAVQATAGNAAVGDFYTAFGRLVHQAGEAADRAVSSALETAGLPLSLAAAMDDASYDAAIRTSHDEGQHASAWTVAARSWQSTMVRASSDRSSHRRPRVTTHSACTTHWLQSPAYRSSARSSAPGAPSPRSGAGYCAVQPRRPRAPRQ
jgi:NAD(P)H-dependent FMN reductase/2-hydroxychromene-2-carboxylate isomerase